MQGNGWLRWWVIAAVATVLALAVAGGWRGAADADAEDVAYRPASHAAPAADARVRSLGPSGQSRDGATLVQRIWTLKAAAERGDAAAMRELGFVASRCAGMAYAKGGIESAIAAVSANVALHGDAALAGYRGAGQRLRVQCDVLASWSGDLRGYGREWRERAAEAGDLAATIRMQALEEMRDADVVAGLLDHAVASGDAGSLREIGPLLLSYQLAGKSLPGYEGISFDEFDHYALNLIACERGLDCGQGSSLMDEICLVELQCTATDLPGLLDETLQRSGELRRLEAALRRMRGLLGDAELPALHSFDSRNAVADRIEEQL